MQLDKSQIVLLVITILVTLYYFIQKSRKANKQLPRVGNPQCYTDYTYGGRRECAEEIPLQKPQYHQQSPFHWMHIVALVLLFTLILILEIQIIPIMKSMDKALNPPKPSTASQYGKAVAMGTARGIGGRAAGSVVDALI